MSKLRSAMRELSLYYLGAVGPLVMISAAVQHRFPETLILTVPGLVVLAISLLRLGRWAPSSDK
ncbi:MAG: hypothetical protein P8J78_09830 [Maricaulis sp.]|nr:hypothetical protein [Maricaulis sp.]